MEAYSVLKSVLDQLCGKMDLKSWTIHENSKGTVCTVRFSNDSSILDPAEDHNNVKSGLKYKRKWKCMSDKQGKRDDSRMREFIARKDSQSISFCPRFLLLQAVPVSSTQVNTLL